MTVKATYSFKSLYIQERNVTQAYRKCFSFSSNVRFSEVIRNFTDDWQRR